MFGATRPARRHRRPRWWRVLSGRLDAHSPVTVAEVERRMLREAAYQAKASRVMVPVQHQTRGRVAVPITRGTVSFRGSRPV